MFLVCGEHSNRSGQLRAQYSWKLSFLLWNLGRDSASFSSAVISEHISRNHTLNQALKTHLYRLCVCILNHTNRQSNEKKINMLLSSPLRFWERKKKTRIKRSRSTRLTCPLSSRPNKEESSGESPALLPPQSLFAQWESTQFRAGDHTEVLLSSGDNSQTCHTPQSCVTSSIFWCWIDSVLLVYTLWVCAGWHTVLFCVLFTVFMWGILCISTMM